MASDQKTPSIIPKAEALKKAGFNPWATVIILLLSTPGFYEFFFNKIGERADKKADAAYDILTKTVDELREDDRAIHREIDDIRQMIMMLSIRGASVSVSPAVAQEAPRKPAAGSPGSRLRSIGVVAGGGSGAGSAMPATATLLPPEVMKRMVEKNAAKDGEKKQLPRMEDLVE